ncbi:MAG: hypothetical protein U0840_02440 [Gemmataceae bacterium]
MSPEELLAELQQVQGEVAQAQRNGSLGDLAPRLLRLRDQVKQTVEVARQSLTRQINEQVVMLRARAEEMEAKKAARLQAPAEVNPDPGPWEDQQGLTQEQMAELVAVLLREAGSAPRRP